LPTQTTGVGFREMLVWKLGCHGQKGLKDADIAYIGVFHPDFRRTALKGFRENSGYK